MNSFLMKIKEGGRTPPMLNTACSFVNSDSFKQKINKFLVRSIPFRKLGIGIAGNQIGLSNKICSIKLNNGNWATLINPIIKEYNGEIIEHEEGCLSIPNKLFTVKRNTKIKIEYNDLNYKIKNLNLKGLEAIIAQHEIDHLNGVLISDNTQ